MKRLYRSRTDVMIGGVCSGIAKYFEVDPTAVRLAFVLLLFAGGGGLWIYLVLWIIMPLEPQESENVVDVAERKETPTIKKAPSKSAAVKKTKPTEE